MCARHFIIGFTLCFGSFFGSCGDNPEPSSPAEGVTFDESVTFYASFDHGYTADIATGDSILYEAPSWQERRQLTAVTDTTPGIDIREGEGHFGDALWIDSNYNPVYFYRGEDNIAYQARNWSGSVSFWLRLSPDEDLPEGYSDPVQLTTRGWNDGALFVDFTDQVPRSFRFAFFADRDVWDPEHRDWEDIPVEDRPMVVAAEPVFDREQWTHIAFSFEQFNTGRTDGTVHCYINGEFHGTLSGREQTVTWSPDEIIAIWLGYNYRGYIDELAIFDRVLSDDEIRSLYQLTESPLKLQD